MIWIGIDTREREWHANAKPTKQKRQDRYKKIKRYTTCLLNPLRSGLSPESPFTQLDLKELTVHCEKPRAINAKEDHYEKAWQDQTQKCDGVCVRRHHFGRECEDMKIVV